MKQTRTVLALTAVAALAGLAGCMDLEERPITGVAADYYGTAAGANAATVGAYTRLKDFYGGESEVLMGMVGTDSWERGEQLLANGLWNDYNAQLGPAVGDPLLNRWQNFYQGVNAANTAIAAIGNSSALDAGTKNVRLAESRFIRALMYLNLVRTWGAVQLDTLPTAGVVTTATRTPASEVYAKVIVPDLEFAIANLPAKQSEIMRATKGAAQTLLAEVYLTRAAAGDFDKARDLATAVISSNTYKLNTSFRALFCGPDTGNGSCDFLASQKTDPEIIFSVQFIGDGAVDPFGNSLHLYWTMGYDGGGIASPTLARTRAYGRPYRRTRPTLHLLRLFNRTTDTRYDDTFQKLWRQPSGDTAIYFPGTPVADKTGQGKKYGENEYTSLLYPSLLKHQDQTRADPNTFPGHRDRTLWRLGEVYLLRAEANIRAGRPAEAIADINVIRARAAKPGQVNTLGATELVAFNADPLGFLLDERERELAGEEFRWWTLARQGTAVFLARIKAYNAGAAPNVKDFHILRPIPQTQIDRTEGGKEAFPQNPGY
jgi:starch-binding outer membrane protein, SusD/RagB family